MMTTITEVCTAFMDKDRWLHIDDIEKNKHGFNILRFVSIMYPYHMNLMNHKDINIARATDFWHLFMVTKYTGVPKWFWATAGANKVKPKKKVKLTDKFTKKELNDYCNFEEIHYDLLVDMFEFNPDSVLKDLKEFSSANKTSKNE
jgi:hypothetical protein